MLQRLHDIVLYLDYTLWYYINTQWHTATLDAILPYLRNQWTWAPLYLFLLVFMPMNFGRRGWIWCLAFIISFALSDFSSATLFKPFFHRIRPCNNAYLAEIIHIIVPCGGGNSFPSNHAANHFCLGVFGAITLQKRIKWIWFATMAWAFAVSYSQVYVGVHFPLDVFAGAILGICIGGITGKLFNRYFDLAEIKPQSIPLNTAVKNN